LWELPLAERVRFGALVAALSVTRLGGADAAPTWADLETWHQQHPTEQSLAGQSLAALISAHSGPAALRDQSGR
jgi:hypothetical protein